MPAQIFNPWTGVITIVKNLGWLLRNYSNVRHFAFVYRKTGPYLYVTLTDGRVFGTEYGSIAAFLRLFGNRPVFEGVPFQVYRQDDSGKIVPLTDELILQRSPERFLRMYPEIVKFYPVT